MPLISIETNLQDADFPSDFEVQMHKSLAPVMGKDISKLITNLKTNQRISSGDNPKNPVILFRCWSFSVFNNVDKRYTINEFIYKYLKQCFPDISYDHIKVVLHDMPAEDVGPKPSTVFSR